MSINPAQGSDPHSPIQGPHSQSDSGSPTPIQTFTQDLESVLNNPAVTYILYGIPGTLTTTQYKQDLETLIPKFSSMSDTMMKNLASWSEKYQHPAAWDEVAYAFNEAKEFSADALSQVQAMPDSSNPPSRHLSGNLNNCVRNVIGGWSEGSVFDVLVHSNLIPEFTKAYDTSQMNVVLNQLVTTPGISQDQAYTDLKNLTDDYVRSHLPGYQQVQAFMKNITSETAYSTLTYQSIGLGLSYILEYQNNTKLPDPNSLSLSNWAGTAAATAGPEASWENATAISSSDLPVAPPGTYGTIGILMAALILQEPSNSAGALSDFSSMPPFPSGTSISDPPPADSSDYYNALSAFFVDVQNDV